MCIKFYSKDNLDHCAASFITLKAIIIRGEKRDFLIFFLLCELDK